VIRITASREGDRHTLVIEGHADSAPKGWDIVCAAISAIYQTALLGFAACAKQYSSYVTFEGDVTDTDSAAGSAHHKT
jgi:uncharacterized protein